MTKLKKVWLERNDCIDIDFDEEDEIKSISKTVTEKCGFLETSSYLAETESSQCGRIHANIADRVVDGYDKILRGQYPFLATIHNSGTNNLMCGGTLISARHILTGLN